MSPIAVLIIAAAGAASLMGTALLVLGLRGHRINDHPVCRGCRFDLVGVFPGKDVCPECGRGLSVAAVRIGRRRRQRGMILCGAVLLTAVLAGGGLVGVQTARGFDWNTVKPASMLAWEVRRSGADG